MGVIPLSDVSRQPNKFPVVTACIVAANVFVFGLELIGGQAFVSRWSLVPADIVSGHNLMIWTALWFITGGVLGAYVAIQERNAHLSWGWTMAFSLVAIAAGVLAIMYPRITLAGLMSLIATFGIVGGVALLIGAGKMQSFQGDVNRAVRNPART
jgi:uncharacterized membrane protein HdeD (DUF308 family)